MVKGKRITKKQLREPDEFITLTERAFIFFGQHSKKITVGGVFILVLILAIVLFQMSERKKEEEAARVFGVALETYERGVAQAQAREDSGQGLKETLAKFEEVVTKFPRTSSGKLSRLYEGMIHLRQSEYDDAMKAYSAFLENAGKERLYRYLAWEGLGHTYEGKKDYAKALEAYQKILDIGEGYQLAEAHLNMGNCYEKLGKAKEALDNFKAFLGISPKSLLADVILRKVSILEKR
jgi:tetratricopeptide (TPR) repeat protein